LKGAVINLSSVVRELNNFLETLGSAEFRCGIRILGNLAFLKDFKQQKTKEKKRSLFDSGRRNISFPIYIILLCILPPVLFLNPFRSSE